MLRLPNQLTMSSFVFLSTTVPWREQSLKRRSPELSQRYRDLLIGWQSDRTPYSPNTQNQPNGRQNANHHKKIVIRERELVLRFVQNYVHRLLDGKVQGHLTQFYGVGGFALGLLGYRACAPCREILLLCALVPIVQGAWRGLRIELPSQYARPLLRPSVKQ